MAEKPKPNTDYMRLTKAADALLVTAKDEKPRPDLIDGGYTDDDLIEAHRFLRRMGVDPTLKGGTE